VISADTPAPRTLTAFSARCAPVAPRSEILFSNRSHFAILLECANSIQRENGNLSRRITSTSTLVASICMTDKPSRPPKMITVSERNLQNAAIRLLPKHNKLVSPEVDYLRRVLGEKATQAQIDEKVQQVRKLPWAEIVRE